MIHPVQDGTCGYGEEGGNPGSAKALASRISPLNSEKIIAGAQKVVIKITCMKCILNCTE